MTRPLRIAVWHNLSSGGAKRALFDHVSGLVARGHHVEAWCPPTADRAFLPLSQIIDEHVVPLDLHTPRPLRALSRFGLRSPSPRILNAMHQHCAAVGDAIGDDFDVLLATSCQLLTLAPIALHVRIPKVLYLQEPNRRFYEARPTLTWIDARGVSKYGLRTQARAELDAIGAYDRVLVNSRFSRENVLRAYGVSSHVCYLGIDTATFCPAADPPRDYLVGVGAFVPEKNVELVIRAMGRVAPTPPPLVWIGDHVDSEAHLADLVQLADELGVAFTPRHKVSDDELIAIVGGARAMVYAPSLEPFGLAPLEANACNVPVIAGAEGGVRETVVDGVNGLLVEADAHALAVGIERLWNSPDAARAMGAAARHHVTAHWSLERAADRLEEHLVAVARVGATA